MKTTARHDLALQHGTWGYFGSVALELESVEGRPGIVVEFSEAVQDYRAAIQFGILYAYEKCCGGSLTNQRLRVRVLEVRFHAVDTTQIVAAYVAAFALWKALGRNSPREPTLDAESGVFVFPK